MSEHVVVVGASVGGVRTAKELRQLGFGGDITVVKPPYFWSDRFGLKIQMVGRPEEAESVHVLDLVVSGVEKTVALYERDGRMTAAVTFGWPRGLAACRHACDGGARVAEVQAELTQLAERHRTLAKA